MCGDWSSSRELGQQNPPGPSPHAAALLRVNARHASCSHWLLSGWFSFGFRAQQLCSWVFRSNAAGGQSTERAGMHSACSDGSVQTVQG